MLPAFAVPLPATTSHSHSGMHRVAAMAVSSAARIRLPTRAVQIGRPFHIVARDLAFCASRAFGAQVVRPVVPHAAFSTVGGRPITASLQERIAAAPKAKAGSVEIVNLNAEAPLAWEGDLFIIGFFTDAEYFPAPENSVPVKATEALDGHFGGIISELIAEGEFEGKPGQVATGRVSGKGPVRKVALVGLGASADMTMDGWRKAGAAVADLAKKNKGAKRACFYLPVGSRSFAGPNAVQALVEGVTLGLHEDTRFKSEAELKKSKPTQLAALDLLGWGFYDAAPIDKGAKIGEAVLLAKELVNGPPNKVTPSLLAETARKVAAEGGLEVKVLEKAECEALGMGLFLGVSAASSEPPKFIHLTYTPKGEVTRKLAIIGKGLTFDSGGYNLKAGAGSMIEHMKIDMAGSAATLAAAQAISKLAPEGVQVHFIVASCENMIAGGGMRPGDILTGSSGVTVEINNTDAEGRLTLADAIVYAEKLGVDSIVDCATLTGACMVALGPDIAGLFASKDELARELEEAAKKAGEKLWRLPLEDKYAEMNKSQIADIKNSGGRMGGAITAALFLKHFVKAVPWAHIDLAGPVFNEKVGGATGYGVRTLVNYVLGKDATIDG
eukprot:tig00021127_g18754.t1